MLKVKLDPLSQRRIILVEFKSVQFKISVAFWFEIVIDDQLQELIAFVEQNNINMNIKLLIKIYLIIIKLYLII